MNIRTLVAAVAIVGFGQQAAVSAAADVSSNKVPSNPDRPAIAVPSTHFDFGTVVDGTQVLHEFVIRNTGDAPLEVNSISTG